MSCPDRCLICNGACRDTVARYATPDRYERAAGVGEEGYWREWVRCRGCGFHYARYSRPDGVLDRLYASGYRAKGSSWRTEGAEATFRRITALPPDRSESHARIGWIKDRIADLTTAGLLPPACRPQALLDIGGASGVFAALLQDEGWRSHVIDPAEEGRFIEDVLCIPYRQQRYAPGAFGRHFDLVSLIYVLEHAADPDALLRNIAHDLAEWGLVYVEVPDAICFGRKPADDDIFNACHLWMFDPMNLVRLLDRCGFAPLALQRTKTVRGHFSLMVLAGQA